MTASIVIAKGSSRKIPLKNLIDFCGKPLLYWTLYQSTNSKYIHKTFLSTEDKRISMYCLENFPDVEVIHRPAELVPTGVSWEMVWKHALEKILSQYDCDTVVSLCVANPIRTVEDVNNAIAEYWENNHEGSIQTCGSLLSVCCENDLRLWNKDMKSGVTFTYPLGRNKTGQYYRENESIYVFNVDGFKYYKQRYWGIPSIYVMPYWKSFTVDTKDDLELLEAIMRAKILDGLV